MIAHSVVLVVKMYC